jgi:hypothetical protein
VKYWTPSAGGLSSRGTLSFTSNTRDEMVDRTESRDCEAIGHPTPTDEVDSGDQTQDSGSDSNNDPSFNDPSLIVGLPPFLIDSNTLPATMLTKQPTQPARVAILLPPQNLLW